MARYAFKLSLLPWRLVEQSRSKTAYGRLLMTVAVTGGAVGQRADVVFATVPDIQALRFERLAEALITDFGV